MCMNPERLTLILRKREIPEHVEKMCQHGECQMRWVGSEAA